jgi:hypothetical protein
MNARNTLTALLSAGLLLAVPGIASAADSSVAAGTVRDAGGSPARSGTVELYADPSASGAPSGDLTPVARGAIRDGRFALAAPNGVAGGNLPDAAGYRDWLVVVRTPAGGAAQSFSARSGVPAQLGLATTPAAARDRVAAAGNGTGVPRACHYELEKQVDRRVRMSEVHGWKGVSATFQYAADHSADTYVGVAIQGPGGHWSAQGTDHVTNTKVFGQTATQNGKGNRAVSGIFKFNILKAAGRNCPKDIIKRFSRAYRFEGGMRLGKPGSAAPGLSGQCNKAPGRRKLYRATTVFTATAKSFTYDRAFTLFGVTLGSSTTFSSNAQITLANHGKLPVWVCGVNPAGQAVPIADAAMLYAGPRTKN